jgi:hypothetical protein
MANGAYLFNCLHPRVGKATMPIPKASIRESILITLPSAENILHSQNLAFFKTKKTKPAWFVDIAACNTKKWN